MNRYDSEITSIDEAQQFLLGLKLKMAEDVVRQVVVVLQRKPEGSLYGLYQHGRRHDGTERRPICGKGTADKIKHLYREGKLAPYLTYVAAEEARSDAKTLVDISSPSGDGDNQRDRPLDGQAGVTAGDTSDIGPPTRDNQQPQSQPNAHETQPIDKECTISDLHQEEQQKLLSKWLEYTQEVPLESWLNTVTEYFLSPSGLLTWSQDALRILSLDETVELSPLSMQDARKSMLEEFAPQRAMPELPRFLQSHLFSCLQQHLQGDVLWDQWTSAHEARASLAAHIWTRALYLFRFTLGLLTAVPGDKQQTVSRIQSISKIQLVIEDPAYRDEMCQYLESAVCLLGADLIRRGVHESDLFPNANIAINELVKLIQKKEDQLQRLPVPLQWAVPKAGAIRQIAGQIWDGSLGEEPSQNLGQEAVCDLIKLWQECSRASDASRLRLKALIKIRPLPGSCLECRELQ